MPAGRPVKFESVEEIEPIIEEYFAKTPMDEWTVTGLAIALDTTRELLAEYERKPLFSATIKKAKGKVEHSYEISLRKNGKTGDIFALKNFGWKDKQEVENTNTNVDVTETLSVEQRQKIAKLYGNQ